MFYKFVFESKLTWIQRCIAALWILLIWKWKFSFNILTNQYKLLDYFFKISGQETLNDILRYEIILENVTWIDLMCLQNYFISYLIIVNLLFLVYLNNKVFYSWAEFSALHLKDDIVFRILCLVFSLVFVLDMAYIRGDIVCYNYLVAAADPTRPVVETIMDPFYFRFCLLYVYKALTIAIAFSTKQNSLGFRLLFISIVFYILRWNDWTSALIVDASIWYLILNPYGSSLDNLKIGMLIYLEAFMSYTMNTGGGAVRLVRIIRSDGVVDYIRDTFEDNESLRKREDPCRPFIAAMTKALEKNPNWTESIMRKNLPSSQRMIDAALNERAGYEGNLALQELNSCMRIQRNPDPIWRERETNKRINAFFKIPAPTAQEEIGLNPTQIAEAKKAAAEFFKEEYDPENKKNS